MSRPTNTHGDRRGSDDRRDLHSNKGVLAPFLVAMLMGTMGLCGSPAFAGSVPCDCQSCHGDSHGENWSGCSACHDSPPQTAAHLTHFNSPPLMSLRYGDTGVRSTAEAYLFDCGNCHPRNAASHRNDTVDVELHDPLSPPGSLKARNPVDAAYDPLTGTCSNVYCHSGQSVTSGPVGVPLTYPAATIPPGGQLNGSYIMDETCSNFTYDPYTVTYARTYATTPPWGTTGTLTACTECHAFPLTTYEPEVSAGVGDSHQWVDRNGWNWRHAYNMSYFDFGAVACRTCHSTTVTEAGTTSYGPYGRSGEWITAYGAVPLASRVAHVNGVPDVAFDTVNPVVYRESLSLVGAAYDPATKTCSDVSCHFNPTGQSQRWQKKVQWGGPWRYWEAGAYAECDVCHRMGYIDETCTPAP